METTPGHTKARVTEVEDYMPGGNRWHNLSTTWPIGQTIFKTEDQGKSSVTAVINLDISLAIVHRNPHLTPMVHGWDWDNSALNKDLVKPIAMRWMKKNNRSISEW